MTECACEVEYRRGYYAGRKDLEEELASCGERDVWVILESWWGVYEGYENKFHSAVGSEFAAEERVKELNASRSKKNNLNDEFEYCWVRTHIDAV